MINHLLLDSSTNPVGWPLNTSPLNKTPSTRPQVSRNRHPPSDVPSASRMKLRISEAFGSSKNIIYSGQQTDPAVPETSLPPTKIDLPPLALPSSLLSSSLGKRTARRRRIPSSLPPSSPPSSSETEVLQPCLPYRGTRNPGLEDPFGLLRGQQNFSRLRRRHRRQKAAAIAAIAVTRNALRQLENLSPVTPCADSNATSGQAPDITLFLKPTRRVHRDHNYPHGRGCGPGGNGNGPDLDSSRGASDTLSSLLARLPRGRRPLQRQDSHSTTVDSPKTAGEKKIVKQRKKKQKRADDEASHLKGEDRVAYEVRRDARLAHYREVDEYSLYEEDVLWI